jgi:hypothetical protein
MDDRRSNGRTRTSKAASIFFGRRTSGPSCDVEVTDLANGGAGIYKQGLAILPLTFELSFDNLRRTCRMVWRKGNFVGVTFEDQSSPAIGEAEARGDVLTIEGHAFSLFGDPPQLARPDDIEAPTGFVSHMAERNGGGRTDVRFTVGVAIALALPVLISLGAYISRRRLHQSINGTDGWA